MKRIKLRKGLDLPIEGAPAAQISQGPAIQTVGLLGEDYSGLKARVAVSVGDKVGRGAHIFAHKDTPEVSVTAPLSGRVLSVNRGPRRSLISVVISADEDAADPVDFKAVGDDAAAEGITEKLCAAGLWTSFKTRPFSKVPAPTDTPAAIFVNAMDTEPLAPDPALVISGADALFERGLAAVQKLSGGATYLCFDGAGNIPGQDLPGVDAVGFAGPHPAGLAGTHMHFLAPPTAQRTNWTIGYQDVIAIGALMQDGLLMSDRVISLAGPLVKEPRLMTTVAGASLAEITSGEYHQETPARIISGSVLSGRSSASEASGYLGRYARQVTVIKEDRDKNLLSWIRPMTDKFAVQPVLGSAPSRKKFALTSSLNGGRRAMVPIGTFEELMPQKYLPTQLVRALLVMDTDTAQALGALELDEEDLSLLTFACPAKYEYGPALRDCLTKIEKEG
ncbi:MAG: Na(+)-translocating NADH-quinone reductase subunit A [Pseudomonadota bacterium]